MTQTTTKKKTRGGAHNVKLPEQRRVLLSVNVSPVTVNKLQPYAVSSQRSRLIDLMTRRFFAQYTREEIDQMLMDQMLNE